MFSDAFPLLVNSVVYSQIHISVHVLLNAEHLELSILKIEINIYNKKVQ